MSSQVECDRAWLAVVQANGPALRELSRHDRNRALFRFLLEHLEAEPPSMIQHVVSTPNNGQINIRDISIMYPSAIVKARILRARGKRFH